MPLQIIHYLINLKNIVKIKNNPCMIYCNLQLGFLPLLRSLYLEGFIQSYLIKNTTTNFSLLIILRFFYGESILADLQIISAPSKNFFLKYHDLCRQTIGIRRVLFLDTFNGFNTQIDCKEKKIGGKLSFSC